MTSEPSAHKPLLRRAVRWAAIGLAALLLAHGVLTLSVGLRSASAPPIAEDVAIVVSPHPDDETYAMAQTIAEQDIAGKRVVAVLVTDGNASSYVELWAEEHGRDLDGDGDMDEWDFGLARREEYQAAMDVLGADEVVYLGAAASQGEDGFFDTDIDVDALTDELAALGETEGVTDWFAIAPYASDRLMDGDYRNHPDHGLVAEAIAEASERAGGRVHSFKVYAYYLPVWLRLAPVRVEGSPEALERKREAVRAFELIGATSTPELYRAALKDTAEYLVPSGRR